MFHGGYGIIGVKSRSYSILTFEMKVRFLFDLKNLSLIGMSDDFLKMQVAKKKLHS